MKIMSRAALRQFAQLPVAPHVERPGGAVAASTQKVDFTLWSKKRIQAYEESLLRYFSRPIAVLRICRVNLEVPVLEGTDDLTLNRGVGHIPGTGFPGQEGNIGIAGHRDGFFRVLKDVAPGDVIELVSAKQKDIYTVDQIVLVLPNDTSVLSPRTRRSLTLVTCYPFYFVGSAPKRYIVQASLKDSEISPISRESTKDVALSEY
jgi:sortase A